MWSTKNAQKIERSKGIWLNLSSHFVCSGYAPKKGKSDKIYKRPLEIELDKYPVLGDFCSFNFFLARRYSVIFKCISVFDQFFFEK